jgi:hypothetical protein
MCSGESRDNIAAIQAHPSVEMLTDAAWFEPTIAL